jgi:hypothetical protein
MPLGVNLVEGRPNDAFFIYDECFTQCPAFFLAVGIVERCNLTIDVGEQSEIQVIS